MKRAWYVLLVILLAFGALPAGAEKLDALPDIFRMSVEAEERKEEDNRYFILKEYLTTVNDAVNEELRAIVDGFDQSLRPAMQPDEAKNAKRNSRLDIETVYQYTGQSWLSVMVLARTSYERAQLSSPFETRTWNLETGARVTLSDIFANDSPAWDLLASRVREHVGSLFPNEPRNPEAVERLASLESLKSAGFTLSAMELTFHYEAKDVYPGKACLMHVRFFYDELWDMMTPEARMQTDNSHWKMVALTCDDGPNYTQSSNALSNFRREGARVTYFTVGKLIPEYPEVLMRQFDQNHLIASHSYHHWSGYSLKPESRLRELAMCDELLLDLVGERNTLFRAPGGTYPPWAEAGIGLPIIQWSVDTYDYTGKDPAHIFYSVRNNVRDGDIILMHDTGAELWKAIPRMAEYLRENGYRMVTVEELAHMNGIALEPNVVYHRLFEGDFSPRTDSNI